MEDKRLVKKRYISMSATLIGFAIILFLLPTKYSTKELNPEKLLLETIDDSRFVSTDEVADALIKGDRYMRLIDVRTVEEYKKFRLPGAVNLPLEKLLEKDKDGDYKWESLLNSDTYKNVFYSNGSAYSNQAWMIVRRLNFKNNYVMKGGLNLWVETILRPQKPKQTASDSEFALYSKRKASSMFFGKGGTKAKKSNDNSEDKSAPMIIKKKEEEEEGGC